MPTELLRPSLPDATTTTIPAFHAAAAAWHNELRFDLDLDLLSRAVEFLSDDDVDVIAVLGDLTHFGDKDSGGWVLDELLAAQRPVFLVPGNHDITSSQHSLRRFTKYFSEKQVVPGPLSSSLQGAALSLYGVTRDAANNQLRGVAPEMLPGDVPLHLVLSHYPLLPMEETLSKSGLKHAGDLNNLSELGEKLLKSQFPVLVLHGHLHVRATTVSGPMLHFSFAAIVEPPHECSIVSLTRTDNGVLQVRRSAKSVHPSSVEHLPVLSPVRETWQFVQGAWVQVDPA